METLLREIAHYLTLSIECMAMLVIALGTIEAMFVIVRVVIKSAEPDRDRTDVWLRFARWLVAGMTLQLAADIVSTSFEPTWEDITRQGAIAVIRTFLSFFLDKEMEARREQQEVAQRELAK